MYIQRHVITGFVGELGHLGPEVVFPLVFQVSPIALFSRVSLSAYLELVFTKTIQPDKQNGIEIVSLEYVYRWNTSAVG